jgi:hypothetical protein
MNPMIVGSTHGVFYCPYTWGFVLLPIAATIAGGYRVCFG